jgi:hypothetical protein
MKSMAVVGGGAGGDADVGGVVLNIIKYRRSICQILASSSPQEWRAAGRGLWTAISTRGRRPSGAMRRRKPCPDERSG